MKLQNLRSRSILLAILSVMLALVLVGRLYYLQILRGEDFTQSFEESVTRTVSIPARRGRILDRNGAVIADTAASLNVTIVDNTGNTREENDRLNSIILKTLQILDQNGEETEGDFGISWDGSGYVFDYDGFEHLRFLADVYGYPLTDTLSEEERAASAEDVLLMLADRYRISRDLNTDQQRSEYSGSGFPFPEYCRHPLSPGTQRVSEIYPHSTRKKCGQRHCGRDSS